MLIVSKLLKFPSRSSIIADVRHGMDTRNLNVHRKAFRDLGGLTLKGLGGLGRKVTLYIVLKVRLFIHIMGYKFR